MIRNLKSYRAASLAVLFLTAAWIASCNDDGRSSPAAPTVPEAVDGPKSTAPTTPGQGPETTSLDPRSDTATRAVPEAGPQDRSPVAVSATQRPPTFDPLLDAAIGRVRQRLEAAGRTSEEIEAAVAVARVELPATLRRAQGDFTAADFRALMDGVFARLAERGVPADQIAVGRARLAAKIDRIARLLGEGR